MSNGASRRRVLKALGITVVVYPGASGLSSWYEDDGHSFAHKRGDFMHVEMEWRESERRLRRALRPGSRVRPPMPRPIEVRVAGQRRSKQIIFEGRPVDVSL